MLSFFTTVGFSASIRMLLKGGIQVVIFLIVSMVLIIIQNIVGVTLAGMFGGLCRLPGGRN